MTIQVENLTKRIGNQTILCNLSLQIKKGEVVGLLGPNGAGKSTLMKCLTGLWRFDSGKVEVCGIDMNLQPTRVRSHIGYLPENNPLYEDMYVPEYLHFMASLKGIKDKQSVVEHTIEQVWLNEVRHKKIGELSKGYRQRVGLGQALMGNPELLILDEPTTGLDPNQLDDMRNLLRTLGQQHTILLSTHIMQEVEAVCTRVVILHKGTFHADISNPQEINIEQLFREVTLK